MSAIVQAYQVANASERGEPVMRAMTMEEAPNVVAMRKEVEGTVRGGGCPPHKLAKKYSDSWFPGDHRGLLRDQGEDGMLRSFVPYVSVVLVQSEVLGGLRVRVALPVGHSYGAVLRYDADV